MDSYSILILSGVRKGHFLFGQVHAAAEYLTQGLNVRAVFSSPCLIGCPVVNISLHYIVNVLQKSELFGNDCIVPPIKVSVRKCTLFYK